MKFTVHLFEAFRISMYNIKASDRFSAIKAAYKKFHQMGLPRIQGNEVEMHFAEDPTLYCMVDYHDDDGEIDYDGARWVGGQITEPWWMYEEDLLEHVADFVHPEVVDVSDVR